eukprot:gb/GECH01007376.1/.p1 GENE.gb/GECH01007376.1/~~gb/GECH01007376.1/.p1  ORF type:complete len:298 (+),score=36.50 gb/GECH01007376.1/:1-894(+)
MKLFYQIIKLSHPSIFLLVLFGISFFTICEGTSKENFHYEFTETLFSNADSLQELKLDSSSRRWEINIPKSFSSQSRANKSFSIESSKDILGSGMDQYFSLFLIGLEIQLDPQSLGFQQDISMSLSLRKTLDNNKLVKQIDESSFQQSKSGYIPINSLEFERLLDSINKTNNSNQVELVLKVEIENVGLEAEVTGVIHLKMLNAVPYPLHSPFQNVYLAPNFTSLFDWNSFRINPNNTDGIISILSNEYRDCVNRVCLSQGGLDPRNSNCFRMQHAAEDILISAEPSRSITVHELPT